MRDGEQASERLVLQRLRNRAIEALETLDEVHALLVVACDATPGIVDDDEFIETGWPARIQPLAARAFGLMCDRGRFNEDREEDEPSDRS